MLLQRQLLSCYKTLLSQNNQWIPSCKPVGLLWRTQSVPGSHFDQLRLFACAKHASGHWRRAVLVAPCEDLKKKVSCDKKPFKISNILIWKQGYSFWEQHRHEEDAQFTLVLNTIRLTRFGAMWVYFIKGKHLAVLVWIKLCEDALLSISLNKVQEKLLREMITKFEILQSTESR